MVFLYFMTNFFLSVEARRIVRSVLTVTKADSLPESENWIREKCRLDIDLAGSDSEDSESNSDSSDSGANIRQTKRKGTNVTKAITKSAKTEGSVKVMSPDAGNVLTLDDESLSMSPAKKMKTS